MTADNNTPSGPTGPTGPAGRPGNDISSGPVGPLGSPESFAHTSEPVADITSPTGPLPGGDQAVVVTHPPSGLREVPSRPREQFSLLGRVAYVLLGISIGALITVLAWAGDTDNGTGGSPMVEKPAVEPRPQTTVPDVDAAQLSTPEILDLVGPGVVALRPTSGLGGGSGFVVSDDGVIVTNAHVLGTDARMEVAFADGTVATAELVGSFPGEDIAVIALVDSSLPAGVTPLVLRTDPVPVGSDVVAIGNALNFGADPTVTSGIVSALDRELPLPGGGALSGLVQTDAAINPGNSGGPLVDRQGRVVGVNTAIATFAQNIGFAIAATTVIPLVDDIVAGGGDVRADQAFLGVVGGGVTELGPQTVAGLVGERTPPSGVVVADVVDGSAALGAGLRSGDVIITVDGEAVGSSADLQGAIRSRTPGDTVVLGVWSPADGVISTVDVVLSTRLAR